ncbi:hypothetical protein V1508DRAFT_429338 [Lipomyces doorenjongii]|uniref:uncharacterized protein n=1 Tax=Lipomyces doorenjongii TaxID=383834 RepID=UPI0034CD8495
MAAFAKLIWLAVAMLLIGHKRVLADGMLSDAYELSVDSGQSTYDAVSEVVGVVQGLIEVGQVVADMADVVGALDFAVSEIFDVVTLIQDMVKEVKSEDNMFQQYVSSMLNYYSRTNASVAIFRNNHDFSGVVQKTTVALDSTTNAYVYIAPPEVSWVVKYNGDGGWENWGITGICWVRFGSYAIFYGNQQAPSPFQCSMNYAESQFPGWHSVNSQNNYGITSNYPDNFNFGTPNNYYAPADVGQIIALAAAKYTDWKKMGDETAFLTYFAGMAGKLGLQGVIASDTIQYSRGPQNDLPILETLYSYNLIMYRILYTMESGEWQAKSKNDGILYAFGSTFEQVVDNNGNFIGYTFCQTGLCPPLTNWPSSWYISRGNVITAW